jgi:hypothetical protein
MHQVGISLHELCSSFSSCGSVSGENYEISKTGVAHVVNPELTEYVGEWFLFDSDVSPTESAQA